MKSPQEGKLKSAKEQELIAGNFLSEKCRQEKIVIYQILTRLFGNKKSANIPFGTIDENGVGKFDDINDRALSSLADLGITHIWYTGIIEHAVVSDYRKYGIFPDHPAVVKGRAGSPYAIKDYYDVNPDLANQVEKRMAEFDALIKRTHDHQLRVIIDFVPNHVARKYSSDAKPGGIRDPGQDDDTALGFSPGNNFYYLPDESFKVPAGYTPVGLYHELPGNAGHFIEKPAKVSGNNVFKSQPGIDDWFDTVKLNYGVDYANGERKYFNPIPDTWIKMRDVLLFWTAKNVDGFRCDMAGMVPVEFWEWVIPQVKEKNEHIIFIAEIYKPEQFHAYLDQGKFDFIYDKIHFYDPLKQIVQKKATTPVITESWKSLKGINHNMLRYLENHDEQRIGSSFFAGNAFKALPAMAVISFMSNNPVMIYFGQEVGEPGEGVAGFSGEDGRTTIFDYWGVPSHQKWMNGGKFDGGKLDEQELKLRNSYKQILNICISHPVIREGDFFDLYSYNASLGNITGDQLYYFLRFTENRNLFVIVNFDDLEPAELTIYLPLLIGKHQIFNFEKETRAVDLMHKEAGPLIQFNNNHYLFQIKPAPLAVHLIEF